MEHDTHEDKSTVAERLTGVRDPKDPDGLLTVEQDADRPDPSRYGTPETDTLARERAHYEAVRARVEAGEERSMPRPPEKRGVTALD
ncbi:hypothetical protein P5G50_05715 [Leifsonia sp. F6_8S_P_1B]|uniref:Uncharacterized protein n=1 Tax=Leifsonia williamsii TaxID=3035919 RepID=A0ABT8K9V3_9MICO|nr:hypothetical protein [Leifsonia williamsii]MDN4613947.1 hypothetical protein [Leifsonia williamsii]